MAPIRTPAACSSWACTTPARNAVQVQLGSLDSHATVTCNVSGCQASDVDIVGGGPTAAEANALCRAFDGTVSNDGLLYTIDPGTTFVCPLFVTVLQPAKEDAQYVVIITPPGLTGGENPNVLETPTPVVETPAVVEPTATPTPESSITDVAKGERTPGPPGTGTGYIIQRSHPGGGVAPAVIVCFALALGCALFWVFPRRPHRHAASRNDDDTPLWRL